MAKQKGETTTAKLVKVPGLYESTGMKGGIILPDDDYTFEIESYTAKPDKNDTGTNHGFKLKVLDVKKDENERFLEKSVYYNIYIMGMNHEKFDQKFSDGTPMRNTSVDELKSLCVAARIPIGKSGTIDPDTVTGKTFIGRMRQRKDDKADDGVRNTIKKYMEDDEAKTEEAKDE